MKTLTNNNFKNKVVLLRSDLNSDVVNGKVRNSERIKQSAKTISFLKKQKAKIVVIAHQGRPKKYDFTSLKQHGKLLNKYTKIEFVPDLLGKIAEKAIKNLKSGNAIILENIRKEKDEFKPEKGKKNKIVKFFLPLIDAYVNDAFSVCHRKQTSIVSFPKYETSYAGLLLEKEVSSLKKLNVKNALFILGGSKPEDNLLLLNKNKILTCGIFGQMCVIAKNNRLGKENNKINKKMVKNYEKNLKKLKNKINKNINTPEDFAVEVNGKRKEFSLEKFPTEYVIYDIGKKTQKQYAKEIKKAKVVFMKGPAGFAGKKKFIKGTKSLLKAISKSRAFSVLGGGHLNEAINKSKINRKKFNHISLSGGALLRFVAGKKLPGLEALNKK